MSPVRRLLPSDAVLARLLNQQPRLPYRVIADRYGVSKSTVQYHADRLMVAGLAPARNRRSRPLTEAAAHRRRLMQRWLSEGATQGAIARELGLSRARVSRLVALWELAP